MHIDKRPEEILREAREKSGRNQTQMAQEIGIGLRMYQKIEKGNFPKFKTDNVKKIDDILGTNLYELIYVSTGSHNEGEIKDKKPVIPEIHNKPTRDLMDSFSKQKTMLNLYNFTMEQKIRIDELVERIRLLEAKAAKTKAG